MPARRTVILPPVVAAVRQQLHLADCGLAVLAMALWLPYEQVFQAAPLAAKEGLTIRQLQAVATKLGARLVSVRQPDLQTETGILGIEFTNGGAGHWVYLFRGGVYDPADGTLWDTVDDYLANYQAELDVYLTPVQHGPRQRRHQVR